MKQQIEVDLKWWGMNQNNSGGYWIVNDDVAHWVFVQARNAKEAAQIAERIVAGNSEYCECCGERWSTYSFEWEEGTDDPECYGQYYKDYRPWYRGDEYEARLYFYDGSVGFYKWNASTTFELGG